MHGVLSSKGTDWLVVRRGGSSALRKNRQGLHFCRVPAGLGTEQRKVVAAGPRPKWRNERRG